MHEVDMLRDELRRERWAREALEDVVRLTREQLQAHADEAPHLYPDGSR